MTRLLIAIALVSLLPLVVVDTVLADDAPKKSVPDEKAAGAEKADESKDAQDDGDKPAAGEFHLDLDDIKDLLEADIVLPKLDELGKEAGQGQPEAEAAEGEQEDVDINPAEVVKRIIDNMGQAAQRLTQQKDTGQETVEVEVKVIDDLSDLIKWVKQKQAQSQQQQQQQKRKSARDSERQRQQRRRQGKKQGQQQTARQQRSQQPMQDEKATHGQVQHGDLPEVSEMLADRWGDLLPNRPRETMQSIQNMILQEYVDLLDRYYYSLARNRPQIKGKEE